MNDKVPKHIFGNLLWYRPVLLVLISILLVSCGESIAQIEHTAAGKLTPKVSEFNLIRQLVEKTYPDKFSPLSLYMKSDGRVKERADSEKKESADRAEKPDDRDSDGKGSVGWTVHRNADKEAGPPTKTAAISRGIPRRKSL